jgi:4a-hydroxytetrahydrobiopterin dehydratase
MPPLRGEQAQRLLGQLAGWEIVEGHHLRKGFRLPDFVTALAFVNRVGEVAEKEGHHPGIFLTWGRVRIEIHTHKVDGLTESDFILAAKIDAL